ncbi:hypothetical protein ACXR2U_06505 [Jatrophihabitans sp. YIM 134969]
MTVTTVTPRRVVDSLFAKAWVESPADNRHQLTHAVDSGFRIALCGMGTGVEGTAWPADATVWDSPLGRCPVCARAVYGSGDRRS